MRFKDKALKHKVRDDALWLRATKLHSERRVVDSARKRKSIIRQCNQDYGHRGRNSTYQRISYLYYWKGMIADIAEALKTCPQCQKADTKRKHNPALHSSPVDLFACWILDVQYMPDDRGYKAIIEAREELTHWPEARPLKEVKAAKVAEFIKECIITRFGVPLVIKVDGGPEFKAEVKEACEMLFEQFRMPERRSNSTH